MYPQPVHHYSSPEYLQNPRGFWLLDAGPQFSNLCFDITRFKRYPPELKGIDTRHAYELWVAAQYYLERTLFPGAPFHNDFHKIVQEIRRQVAKKFGLNLIQPILLSISNNSERTVKNAYFFIEVAQKVIAGEESFSSAAAKYGVNKTNVRIWSLIFLVHGRAAFTHGARKYSPATENRIVEDYLINGLTIVNTCVKYLIFNQASFKNMLRRYRRSQHCVAGVAVNPLTAEMARGSMPQAISSPTSLKT